jgi:hypothetical protein
MRSNDRASHGPRARRLGTSIPAAGCKRQANTAPGLLSPQPEGLKPFVDFCGVARSGETAAGIAQHSRLQKSANSFQRPSWDFISASLRKNRENIEYGTQELGFNRNKGGDGIAYPSARSAFHPITCTPLRS